jgi:hypothetical protein
MQQPRQLYGLGSLVKKITKPIKKIIKSPIGKAALGAAALYGVNQFGIPGTRGFGKGSIANFLLGKRNVPIKGGADFIRGGGILDKLMSGFGDLSFGQKAFLGGGALLSALPFFTQPEEEEEVVEEGFDVTPGKITNIVDQARRRDPSLRFLPQEQFVRPGFFSPFAAAEGGIADLDKPKRGLVDEAGSYAGIKKDDKMYAAFMNQVKLLMANGMDEEDAMMSAAESIYMGKGFNKGGIAELPQVRMLEGGVPEIDYRQSGGFVPMGKKEKADDVPAMLSKNEFVMTADAVRGMGDGNVEKGAQRMYDQMRQLENRVV